MGRHRKEGLEKARRMEKKEKLEKSWNLVRVCRDLIKENNSNWQERKVTEEERQKIQEMRLEREARLEKQKQK